MKCPRKIVVLIALCIVVWSGIFLSKRFIMGDLPTYRIGSHEFQIEVASTWTEQKRGLGYRMDLCQECGMLFLFATPARYGFWMKGMEFPLDILWIRDDRVVSIERNIAADDPRTLTPTVMADQVLEINAGLVDRYGISVGDPATGTIKAPALRDLYR